MKMLGFDFRAFLFKSQFSLVYYLFADKHFDLNYLSILISNLFYHPHNDHLLDNRCLIKYNLSNHHSSSLIPLKYIHSKDISKYLDFYV